MVESVEVGKRSAHHRLEAPLYCIYVMILIATWYSARPCPSQ